MVDSNVAAEGLKVVLAVAGTGISVVAGTYRIFVPRSEAKEYRKSIEDYKLSTGKRIEELTSALNNKLDERIRDTNRRFEGLEFSLSRMVTRESLEDIISPLREGIRDIKQMLRDKHG